MRLSASKSSASSFYSGLGEQLYDLSGARPALDLNFASNGSLVDSVTGKSLVTFTRASSGTHVDGDGVIQTAGNNVARFDHNPTTGESLGLLVEESRTNLMPYSEEFDNVAWSTSSLTITADDATAPDGTETADKWLNTSTTGIISNSISKAASAITYTASLWVKSSDATSFSLTIDSGGTGDRGRCVFNITTGELVSTTDDGTFTGTSGTITAYPDSWYRLTVTTTTNTGTIARWRAFSSGSGDIIYIWGAQLEEGSFPTSYIRTEGSTVTRSADVASITGTNFSSWYNQTEGTVAISWNKPWGGNWTDYDSFFVAKETANPTQNFISFGSTNGANNQIYWTGKTSNVSQLDYKQYPASGPSSFKHAIAVASNDAAFAHAGSISGRTDDSITLPTVDKVDINAVNSHISRLTYWPTRLSNDTLQTITR